MFPNILLNIWQRLELWDRAFFIKVNGEWTNPVFDAVLPFLRSPVYWAPLYLFLLVFITLNFRSRGLWWALFFLCTFAVADMISSRLIKEVVERIRPCNDPTMEGHVRLLVACGSGHSFTSTHAVNHFALATFFFISFRQILPKWAWIGFVWAFAVIYAQVYVGIHYPLDVLSGAVIGILIGMITGKFFIRQFPLQ